MDVLSSKVLQMALRSRTVKLQTHAVLAAAVGPLPLFSAAYAAAVLPLVADK